MRPFPVGTAEPQPLVDAVGYVINTRYANLAASMVVIYDHIVTFDQEVEYVWKEPCSKGKFLFLTFRYYGLLATIFNDYVLFSQNMTHSSRVYYQQHRVNLECFAPQYSCYFWMSWQGWTGVFVSGALAQIILLLRIRALYMNDRTITVILIIGILVTMASAASIIGTALRANPVELLIVPPQIFCGIRSIPKYLPTFFIPLAMFDALLAGLAIYKWLKDVGVSIQSSKIVPELFVIIVRDSTVYFIMVTLLYCTNAVIWIVKPHMFELPVGFMLALTCVMGNRLILNIRARHQQYAPRQSGLDAALSRFDLAEQIRTARGVPAEIV
ncbi:hypothetical protein BV25DRAFT_1913699 [Artomyces pyxidatus]|uniref:Uncharacterized protein n=1 Tax=Artomyces pyxidatus TaxID=48021 RepID=A0ACB8TA52_9AGAM|nr:hypothetical protein BV25DRAFT_1913699 [Artomyces pyxidatus]